MSLTDNKSKTDRIGKEIEFRVLRFNPEKDERPYYQNYRLTLERGMTVLDALMDQPLIDLLDTVILSTPIKLALLDKTGPQGEIYKYVLQYEQCNWDDINKSDDKAAEYIQSYLHAVHWADESMRSLLLNV